MPRRWLAAIFGIPALLAALWTVFAGKDLNWDLLHYHYYVAQSLVENRAQDYFAARTESYLQPLGYLPFYAMASAGWHSVAASMLLAALHSASIGLLFLLTWGLLPHRPVPERAALAALGAALGAATAVFWTTAGTSFLDPLLAVPMLGGVVLLSTLQPHNAVRLAAAAGALFGVAAALKYSNAFYALCGLAFVISARSALAYAAGGALAAGLVAGPWLLRLWRELGNPFFPHLNAWFGAREAPAVTLAAERFAPQSLGDALSLPLRMALPDSMVYAEISAPDLRFAALLAALAVLAILALLRRRKFVFDRLLAFFMLSLAAWIAVSANGRYGLLVLLLAGPCLVLVAERLFTFRYGAVALGTLLAAQGLACIAVSPTRWFIAERWSSQWLAFEAPTPARAAPAVYLSVETQAMTAAIPFLHPDAAFMNLQGREADAATAARIDAFAQRTGTAARVLGRGLRLQADGRPRPEALEFYDARLARFGYRVDAGDCFAIAWQSADADPLSRWANRITAHPESRAAVLSMAACALVRIQRDPREVDEERRISRVFDRLERGCPRLFRGVSAVTERLAGEWVRDYPALEARLQTRGGRLVLEQWFKLRWFDLGGVPDWSGADAPRLPACGELAQP